MQSPVHDMLFSTTIRPYGKGELDISGVRLELPSFVLSSKFIYGAYLFFSLRSI